MSKTWGRKAGAEGRPRVDHFLQLQSIVEILGPGHSSRRTLSEHFLATYSLVRTGLGITIEGNGKIEIQGGRGCFAVVHRGTARYQLRWAEGQGRVGREREGVSGGFPEVTPNMNFQGRVDLSRASWRRCHLTPAGFYRIKDGKDWGGQVDCARAPRLEKA